MSFVILVIIPTISNHFDIIDGEKVQLKIRNPVRPEEYFSYPFGYFSLHL